MIIYGIISLCICWCYLYEKKDLYVLRYNNGFLFFRGLLDNLLCL